MVVSRIDERLKEFATEHEARIIDEINARGTQSAAAQALGLFQSAVSDSLARLRARAAARGYSPDHEMTRPVPQGYRVKGVSTYFNKDGVASGQWVKSQIDDEAQRAMFRAAAEAMAEELPRVLPFERPDTSTTDLLNLYTITDAHVGMKAWAKETGADWDLEIAERTITRCFELMVMQSPSAETAVINQQGDFLHYDGLDAVTPMNKHLLDADSRFSKMVKVAIRVLRRLIEMSLMRHDTVIVILAEGNHDIASSVWLRHMFAALYENEPRVTVDTSERPYYVHEHGQTMIAVHHGHLKKAEQLPLTFAAMFPEIWGRTTKRVCHIGHLHHVAEMEHAGMDIVRHPTLAAPDAYAARHAWISKRQAQSITYSKRFGQVGRIIVCPEMVA